MVDDARFAALGRRLAAGAAIALLASLAPRSAGAACPAGRAHGQAGDRLRVGFAPMPPFVVPAGTDGQVRGFAIDLLRQAAEREGWKLELVELSLDTLRRRLAGCELDVGVAGVPVSAAMAETVDFSQPYFSTETTAIVRVDDLGRAGPLGESWSGRLARAALRGLVWGLAALALLAVASSLLNATSRRCGGRGVTWRRADASVGGPLDGLRWLGRSATGRLLAAVWIGVGLLLGTTGWTGGAVRPLGLGDDPLRALVEEAAHRETLIGERYPDGAHVACPAASARSCFHSFAEGVLAAVAGPREVLCSEVTDLALDGVSLRGDLAIPERYAFLLPPGSPLRLSLDRALLRLHEQATGGGEPFVHCPGDPR